MSQLTFCAVLLLVVHSAIAATLDPVSLPGSGEIGTCPAQERREAVIQNITSSVRMIIQNNVTTSNPAISRNCGPGLWYRVAHLNMSDSSQQCPSAWREYNNITSGVRGCRRPESSSGSCPATLYPTSRQYSRVCGRVIGYQIGSTDAFAGSTRGRGIDSYYVYGVSVTHGTPRNHIWTFAAGLSEGGFANQNVNCPCSRPGHPGNVLPPSFVGNSYYCESGNPTNNYITYHLYSTDPLWDGQQCEGQCCSNGKSPPWFSVELTNPTTDDIEVRICMAQGSFDDVAIELLEFYIQN